MLNALSLSAAKNRTLTKHPLAYHMYIVVNQWYFVQGLATTGLLRSVSVNLVQQANCPGRSGGVGFS